MIKNDLKSVQPDIDKLFGMYRGVIEDNKDPNKMGGCKIRVWGIHTELKQKTSTEGIPTEELPWAYPALGLFEGNVTGFGSWMVPLQGSHVFLFFENGHILQPRYFATIPGKPEDQNHGLKEGDGFSDPDKEYPNKTTEAPHKPNQVGESDFHRLAKGEVADTIVESKNEKIDKGVNIANDGTWDEPESYYKAEYPHNKVFSTHSGITIEIDDTSGEERIHIYHPSNSYIEIDKDGNIVVRNAKDKFEIVDNNKKTHIVNDYDRTNDNNRTNKVGVDQSEEIGNNQTENIGNNETRTIGADQTEDVSGNKTITVGGATDETSSSTHTIVASTINLNP